jgi:4-hydroxythreonine-4-phosphate dehydrogenase
MSKLPIIGISIGDINSVAVEVIIKSLVDHRLNEYCIPVVYGSSKVISFWRKNLNLPDFQLNIVKSIDQINARKSNIINVWEEDVEIKPGEATELAGKYAFKALEAATNDIVEGKIHALVTAPLNKNTVNTADLRFTGHTEYLTERAGAESLMILASQDIRVALVTGHIPIGEIAQKLNKDLIISKIKLFHNSLKNDFGINSPRIAVLGLNPHAGDNGLLGKEELEIIIPAVEQAQKEINGIVFGPYPADGFFGSGQYNKFDGVLAMYHDQGLIPFKSMAFMDGVNITAGLSFVRTSPDHGTAYSIAGKNIANEESFRNALYAALDILGKRNFSKEINSNPLPLTPMKRERFRIDF